ncbi:hypothetical protein BKA61DRAFT_659385 [Leptodontidium sp. MPI-SDFR-AT-0119]|nr:hypothetical protein BKA61DRAFT_659385 [Leptodontidium sp. MPI-SDFR-AT-0119]
MVDAEKWRKAAKWNRMKGFTRAHLKIGNYEIPTHVTEEAKTSPTMKLEARSDEMGYIDSCFPYYPYEFCGESERRTIPATSRTLRSGNAPRTIRNALGKKLWGFEKHFEPAFYDEGGDILGTDDAKRRKREESPEYMKLFLNVENEGSQIMSRNCGRLMSRRERRFLWASLELYRKRKRVTQAREASLSSLSSIATDSENEMDSEPPRKRVKSSPFGRQDDWIPIESQYSGAGIDDRTRRVRFADETQKIRAALSSSGMSSDPATTSGLIVYDKHDAERTFCKERSRSPPMDRVDSESSTASRYHLDERHSVEPIPEEPTGVEQPTQDSSTEVTFRKRMDSGFDLDFSIPDGLEEYRKQHLDSTSRPTRLGATDTCPSTAMESSSFDYYTERPTTPEGNARQSPKAGAVGKLKHGISHIVITPPSPEADRTPLKLYFTAPSTPVTGHTQEDTKNDTRHSLSHNRTSLATTMKMDTDMDKAASKTRSNYVKQEPIEDDVLDLPSYLHF